MPYTLALGSTRVIHKNTLTNNVKTSRVYKKNNRIINKKTFYEHYALKILF